MQSYMNLNTIVLYFSAFPLSFSFVCGSRMRVPYSVHTTDYTTNFHSGYIENTIFAAIQTDILVEIFNSMPIQANRCVSSIVFDYVSDINKRRIRVDRRWEQTQACQPLY